MAKSDLDAVAKALERGDYQTAFGEIKSLADQGNPEAQFKIGIIFAYGKDVSKNQSEATAWFRKAAAQGYANAQYALALIYNEGQGVEKDYAQAVKWFERAAKQGLAPAQYGLAVKYGQG